MKVLSCCFLLVQLCSVSAFIPSLSTSSSWCTHRRQQQEVTVVNMSEDPGTLRQKEYGVTLDMPETYARCGRCSTSFALTSEDLGDRGKGRRVECSVCGHSWYQARDKLFDIREGFELVELPQSDVSRIERNIAADRDPRFTGDSKLYVGNLDFKVTEEDLFEEFSKVDEVGDVTIITDDSGRSKGFAFVTMLTKEGGEKALEKLDGEEVFGRNLNVREPNN
uniref:RRM domain-containing protein n=1 Tax=Ditylum brightwellii TaxID=49249 RepID=A0A6V2PYU0_9STRA|mmetsp:Transcript_35417/g.52866  ORF Transcript_35417/g.52866 Transcript_35417/m.52866 type:complete len:222 (-) Transcript_35417:477-1142(-)